MHVILQNEAGLTREIKAGIAWTPLFFAGFPFFFRGMAVHGIIWTILGICTSQLTSIYLMFVINKMTAKYWMERGYKPVGPGWDLVGPKWGVSLMTPGQHHGQQYHSPHHQPYDQPQVAHHYPQGQQIPAPGQPAQINQG